MKNNILITLTLIFVGPLYAQDTRTISLSDIQVPNAPGFVLLGQTPTMIDKPADPKAFAISLYNLTKGGAMECTPFWLFQHPKYTLEKHLNNKFPVISTLNLSVASANADSAAQPIAVGLRTQLVRLYSPQTKVAIKKLSDSVSVLLADLDTDPTILMQVKEVVGSMNALKAQVPFCIELAAAALGNYEKDALSQSAVTKWGAWLNTRISPPKLGFDMTILARYMYVPETKVFKDSSYIDYGISCAYQKNRLEGSLEYVNRMDFRRDRSFNRLVFAVNYKVSDQITLVSSLGQNFDNVNNLFTMWGIKFGMSPKVKF